MTLHKTTFRLLVITCMMVLGSLFNNGTAQEPQQLSYQVVTSFPSPGPNPSAVTWDGNYLWVADDSTNTIYKLDPSNGEVLLSFPSPGPEPTGLAWDGTHLLLSENQTMKIYKINISDMETGSVVSSINAPVIHFRQGHSAATALAWDGEYIWSAYLAGWSSRVNQVDPTDGTVIRSFFCVADGLAFDGEYLWNVQSQHGAYKGFVDKRDLAKGIVVSYFRTPGYYPTGLAYDGIYFWHTDNGTDTIYKIKVTRK